MPPFVFTVTQGPPSRQHGAAVGARAEDDRTQRLRGGGRRHATQAVGSGTESVTLQHAVYADHLP